FVSHNMGAIERVCTRAVVLERGRLRHSGDVGGAMKEYQRVIDGLVTPNPGRDVHRPDTIIRSVSVVDEEGQPTRPLPLGSTLRLRLRLSLPRRIQFACIGVGFDSRSGERLLTVHTPTLGNALDVLDGNCTVACTIPHFPLAPGEYSVKVALTAKRAQLDVVD